MSKRAKPRFIPRPLASRAMLLAVIYLPTAGCDNNVITDPEAVTFRGCDLAVAKRGPMISEKVQKDFKPFGLSESRNPRDALLEHGILSDDDHISSSSYWVAANIRDRKLIPDVSSAGSMTYRDFSESPHTFTEFKFYQMSRMQDASLQSYLSSRLGRPTYELRSNKECPYAMTGFVYSTATLRDPIADTYGNLMCVQGSQRAYCSHTVNTDSGIIALFQSAGVPSSFDPAGAPINQTILTKYHSEDAFRARYPGGRSHEFPRRITTKIIE